MSVSFFVQSLPCISARCSARSLARIVFRAAFVGLFGVSVLGCAPSTEPTASLGAAGAGTDYSASIVVAGGCFWCVESDLEKLPGVGDVVSGYAGGATMNPTYRNHADHLEVVRAPYDPSVISYRQLVDYMLRHIDPTDAGGQFCDRGHSYTTAIFYSSAEEQAEAEAAIDSAEQELKQTLVTPVRALDRFWMAEDYHQNYYKNNPVRYRYYRNGCGRDKRVAQVWGK